MWKSGERILGSPDAAYRAKKNLPPEILVLIESEGLPHKGHRIRPDVIVDIE